MSVESPPSTRRFESLDIWRGLLCLYIVVEHAGVVLWPGLSEGSGLDGAIRSLVFRPLQFNLGTPLFFVISGYCILSCIDSYRRRGASAGAFLIRRFTRIYPSYWVAVLFFLIVVSGLDALGLEQWHRNALTHDLSSPQELSVGQWVGNLTLTETWRPRVGGPPANIYTRVGWSLCYQEQFYLVCCVLLLLWRNNFHRALACATAVIVGLALAANDVGVGHYLAGLFPQRWHEFAVGLSVYWCMRAQTPRWARRALMAGLGCLALFGVVDSSIAVVGTALFGLSLLLAGRYDAKFASQVWARPLKALGIRSYSIYLIHLPVCMLVVNVLVTLGIQDFWTRALIVVPAAVVVSIAVAWVFHEFIDSRFAQASKARARRRELAPSLPVPAVA